MTTASARATGCELSVVVPTFGGAASLPELCARLAATLEATGRRWEILIVDDASPDETPEVVRGLARREPRIRHARNQRNLGQHPTTVAGLRMAQGAVVVTLDDDLQQPPEAIPRLMAALDQGASVAIGRFVQSRHPAWRRLGSWLLARCLPQAGGSAPVTITSFKALRNEAVQDLLSALPDSGGYYLGTMLLAAIPRAQIVNVDVPHHARRHGRSGYRLGSLLRLATLALQGGARSART